MPHNRRSFLTRGLALTAGSALLGPRLVAAPSTTDDTAASPPLARFAALPRISLGNLESPVEPLIRLQSVIPCAPRLLIKRDDYLGHAIAGNKLCKLEYLMAEARDMGATTIMTIGSIQSNHARVTAMVARRLGLKCVLVQNGIPPAKPGGNFLVNKLLGVESIIVPSRTDRVPTMEAVAADLEKRGERVYRVPLGGSNPTGAWGFVRALQILRDQLHSMGTQIDAIVFSSSSGGTHAGLEVGKRLLGMDSLRIIGVSPDDSADAISASVLGSANPMLASLGLPDSLAASDLDLDDTFVGGGYGMPTDASREAADLFAGTEGILLDKTYTSKAAAALIAYCRKNKFPSDANVLFWHTGGLLALFE